MPILFVLIILLCFPALEIYTLFRVADLIGWWLAVWLILSAVMGFTLIREEKLALPTRLLLSLQAGQTPFAAFFATSKTLLAGVLLIFPGVISDFIALILLLIPVRQPKVPPRPQEPGVIEGTYRRED